ncbi:MAG: response regulator [Planctomycetes bacterium]|nr:response regulator [Planctomycetota bacterium]
MTQASVHHSRILIVDDEPSFTGMLETLLKVEGFVATRVVNDAREAAGEFISFQPDLVILDLNMPWMSGLEVMAQIRDLAGDVWVPIVVISGEGHSESVTKALQSGAQDFVAKPFRRAEVVSRLRNLLKVKVLQEQVEKRNRYLQDSVDERTRELVDSHRDLVRRLSRCAEYRDDETGHHIHRVSRAAELLGKAAGLPLEESSVIREAAAMHDIGKVGIPDSILLKPGKLTPEEWEVMKTHTLIGATILSGGASPLLRLSEQVAMSHHERWDGTGYPAGIGGEEIPLLSRIVSICDVFDALTSRRPYKEPWPVEKAKEELSAQSGRQFDAHLVALFFERWADIVEIREFYPDEPRGTHWSGRGGF